MSIKGQNTKSIRKKSLPNTRLPVVGIENLKLHHEPTTGSSYIDVTNLIVPLGLQNPSPAKIALMRLKDFSNNWILTSNLRPLWMEGVSFEIVTNNTIRLLAGYESLEGEVFTIQFFNHVVNGTVLADVRTPGGSGELLEGQTDFNLGEAIPMKDFTNQWPIQVFRGTTGTPMVRNANNAAYTGDDTIGNYQMIDRGDGYCQVIRFNIAGDVGNEPIMWANHGALGERTDLSVLQRVDKIHGIVDKMRQDLLEVTQFNVIDPTRYDNGVPTQSDLMAFGDKVHQNEQDILKLKDILKTINSVSDSTNYLLGTAISTAYSVFPTGIAIPKSGRYMLSIKGMLYCTATAGTVYAQGYFSTSPTPAPWLTGIVGERYYIGQYASGSSINNRPMNLVSDSIYLTAGQSIYFHVAIFQFTGGSTMSNVGMRGDIVTTIMKANFISE